MNTSPEKAVYVIGFMDGVDVVGSPALGGNLPVWPTYVQDWAGTKKVTNGEIVQGIDTFYQNPTNVPLPGGCLQQHEADRCHSGQLDPYRLGQLESIAKEAK